ncbi:aspartate--tRNA ligase [bacterium]|nr:aspartate--tRNA ligase [bacterium]
MKERIFVENINVGYLEKEIILYGFIESIRKLGSLTFFYLRDGTGKVQAFFNKENLDEKTYNTVEKLRVENIVRMKGILKERPKDQQLRITKGEYEIEGSQLTLLVQGDVPPFEIEKLDSINESIRDKYRYFALRNEKIHNKIVFRSKITQYIREYFYSKDYLEIETPYLIKSTPEGARDFIVPSRNFKGKFYALAQSPQLLKQLLMGSGFEKYFQIARCFRDEDLRSDRQPEFTQLDMERAFIEKDEIFEEIESMFSYIFKRLDLKLELPFERMTYDDALEKYASDKPDLRNPLLIENYNIHFKNIEVNFIQDKLRNNENIRGICTNKLFSRSQIKKIEGLLKKQGSSGLLTLSKDNDEFNFTLGKFVDEKFYESFSLNNNETIFFQVGKNNENILNFLRHYLGEQLGSSKEDFRFLWVVDFPLFEEDGSGGYKASHHPFTSPIDIPAFMGKEEFSHIPSKAYDLVLNGSELASGSIRINDLAVQKKVFDVLGMNEELQNNRFGFFLDAMKFGLPPHGGIALGIARIAAMLLGDTSIKDFIAFPKTTSGACPLTNSPSNVSRDQLDDLGLEIGRKNGN